MKRYVTLVLNDVTEDQYNAIANACFGMLRAAEAYESEVHVDTHADAKVMDKAWRETDKWVVGEPALPPQGSVRVARRPRKTRRVGA